MEDGLLHNLNVGFILQARYNSKRLPGKVLLPMPIGKNRTILWWIAEQLKECKFNYQLIVATTQNKVDYEIVRYCRNFGLECFCGDKVNVLSRYVEICKNKEFHVVVRLTGDNPLIDIPSLIKTIEHHVKNDFDYTFSTGMPLGMNFECIHPDILINSYKSNLSDYEKEHVTVHLKNDPTIRIGQIKFEFQEKFQKVRLTVDYPTDYLVLSTVLSLYNKRMMRVGIKLVKYVMYRYPWLLKINQNNYQKKGIVNKNQEINAAIKILEQSNLHYTASLLKHLKQNLIIGG
jgi:spore coat polysaccharide biosynthesis protein SpsF